MEEDGYPPASLAQDKKAFRTRLGVLKKKVDNEAYAHELAWAKYDWDNLKQKSVTVAGLTLPFLLFGARELFHFVASPFVSYAVACVMIAIPTIPVVNGIVEETQPRRDTHSQMMSAYRNIEGDINYLNGQVLFTENPGDGMVVRLVDLEARFNVTKEHCMHDVPDEIRYKATKA